MCGWVMTVGEMMTGGGSDAARVARTEGTSRPDEKTVDVQMHDRRRKESSGISVAYGTPGRRVAPTSSIFNGSRARDVPDAFSDKFEGILPIRSD